MRVEIAKPADFNSPGVSNNAVLLRVSVFTILFKYLPQTNLQKEQIRDIVCD